MKSADRRGDTIGRRRFGRTLLRSLAAAPICASGLPTLLGAQGGQPALGIEAGSQVCLLANGLGYTPFRDGQGPEEGLPLTPEQLKEDITFLASFTKQIRTYSASGPLGMVAPLASAQGMRVAQGVFLGENEAVNEREIAAGIELANAGVIDSLVVGNEVLTFGTVEKQRLAQYLRMVRRSVPTFVPVTTADIWSTWRAHIDLAADVDFVMGHFYPFWENQPVDGAAALVVEQFGGLSADLERAYPQRNFRVVIGETGWPSAGMPRAPGVIPGPDNQRRFFEELTILACQAGIPFYWFSAIDEEWKWREGVSGIEGTNVLPMDRNLSGRWIGSSWGLFNSNGTLKPHFSALIGSPPPTTRRRRDILTGGQLAAFYDAGVDSSERRRDWLSAADGGLKMAYPSGQEWGAVFVTVGKPVDPPRPWKDFSQFTTLSIRLRGERGGEELEIGVKTPSDPDDGSERKVRLTLDRDYRQYNIPLSDFASRRFLVPNDLTRLYVVCEFVFAGHGAQTIYVDSIQYLPETT